MKLEKPTKIKKVKKPLRKISQQPSAKLKREAWQVFATWIKNRDGWKCCTCPNAFIDSRMNAGHFQPKSLGNVYLFREDNCHAQCCYCNNNSGSPAEYSLYMLKRYGKEKIEELTSLRGKTLKLTTDFLENIVKTYAL